jgi:hypothetical protein
MTDDNTLGCKYDADKVDWSLVDLKELEGFVRVLMYGAKKYSHTNWNKLDHADKRYYSACVRHLSAFQSGEIYDPESGHTHLDHAMANLFILQKISNKGS